MDRGWPWIILQLALSAGGCAPKIVTLWDISDSGTADSAVPAQDVVADVTAPSPEVGSPEVGCTPWYNPVYYKSQPTQMMIVLDRSSSMQQPFSDTTRAAAVQSALLTAVGQYQSKVEFGLEQFPTWQCQTGTCCAGHVSDPTFGNSIGDAIKCMDPHGSACTLPISDSPSHLALAAVQEYFKGKPPAGDRYVLLITASDPSCSGQESGVVCDMAHQAVVALSNDLINDNTPIIVVSVGGSPPDKTSCLWHLGQVGGSSPYWPTSSLELTGVFNQVIPAAARSACKLTTYQPPPGDVELVVSIGTKAVLKDSEQGWSYANTARTSITLAGKACDDFLAPMSKTLSTSYSCSPCASGPTTCPSYPYP